MTQHANSAWVKQELSLGFKEIYARPGPVRALIIILGSALLAIGLHQSFWAANNWPTITLFGLLAVCIYGLFVGWKTTGSQPSLLDNALTVEQRIWPRLALFGVWAVWIGIVIFTPIFSRQFSPVSTERTAITAILAILLTLPLFLSGVLTSLAWRGCGVAPARKLAAGAYLLILIVALLGASWEPTLSATLANPVSSGLVAILGLTSFLAAIMLLCEIVIRRCGGSHTRAFRYWRWWPGNPSRTSYSSLETGFALAVSKILRRRAFVLEGAALLLLLPAADSLIASYAGADFLPREALFLIFIILYAFIWGVPAGRQIRSLVEKLTFTPLNQRSLWLGGYLGSLTIFAISFLTVGYYLIVINGNTAIISFGWVVTALILHILAFLVGRSKSKR